MKQAIKAAFPHTIPVLMGYLFVGIAYGVLMQNAGLGILWVVLMSTLVYAGSMQYVAINFFAGGFTLVEIAIMTLVVNVRHVFYGLSFLERFRGMGAKKPYMIFSLTDETYSLLCSASAPAGVDPNRFLFSISLLDQLYWLGGSVIGYFAGTLIPFDTTGIDFAMTALFLVIVVEQWLTAPNHIPAIVGFVTSVVALLIFGVDNFTIPAMVLILLGLIIFRKPVAYDIRKQEEVQSRE